MNSMIIKKSLSSIFTLLVCLLMTKKGLSELLLLSDNKLFFLKNEIVIMAILLIISLVLITQLLRGSRIKVLFILVAGLFFGSLILTYSINYNVNFKINSQFTPLISTYGPIILLLIVRAINNHSVFDKDAVMNTLLVFSVGQALLGIIQYITKSVIIPIMDNGKPIVNAIYYSHGTSSSNEYFLNSIGGRLRAFGLTNSGLTLGLFTLLGISIILDKKKLSVFIKIPLLIVLGTALLMTITRVIFLALVLLIIFLIFLKKRKSLVNIYRLFIFVQFILIFISSILFRINWVQEYLPTVLSRFSGFDYYIHLYPFDLTGILWGHNLVSFLSGIISIYSVDNEMLDINLDIGLVGYVVFLITVTQTIFGWINNVQQGRSATLLFLIICSFIGIINVPFYFYVPLLILFCLTFDSLPVSNEKRLLE